MLSEIQVSPAGQLLLVRSSPDEALSSRSSKQTFTAATLFSMAATKSAAPNSPSMTFFKDFSRVYLSELCHRPEIFTGASALEPLAPPEISKLEILLDNAPPMTGAEYLCTNLLVELWNELDSWVRQDIKNSGELLADWLKKRAPLWHQVGRVCFHLAENKKDPDYPFAFLATYAPKVSAGGRVQYQPLKLALKEHAAERDKLISLLSPVSVASQKSELVKELWESNDLFHPLMWTPQEAYRFLKDLPVLEESGVLVKVPDWWRSRPRPRVAVKIGENRQSKLGIDAVLDFNVACSLADEDLTQEELEQIMRAQDGLMYLKGQWIEVDRQRLSEALAHWKKIERDAAAGGISFIEGMRLLAGASNLLSTGSGAQAEESTAWSFVDAGSWLSSTLSKLRSPAQVLAKNASPNFTGTLRPYQQIGSDWLYFISSLGLGACLADDMGLGKTVQVISMLLSLKEEKTSNKPSILVLPASLLSNWKSEIQKFAPTISTCFIHPAESSAENLSALALNSQKMLSGIDLVVTTYGMLARQSWLLEREWRLVILDEAQAIKNPSANQTRCVKKLKSESRIALTGTPVENRLGDLWSLFDFLSPGLLGSADRFKRFVKSMDEGEATRYAPLRKLISPYILRRLKSDKSIIADLPDKTELKVHCGLAREQAALYGRTVDELSQTLRDVDGIKRRGLILSYLMRFKQICNHPSQALGDGVYDPSRSGKFERLRSICEEIASRQEKVIVFTQFREMTEPLASFMSEIFARPGLVLHGGTAVSKRKNVVDSFQDPDGPPFAVLSIKAGGTGLNLTAASHVIHFDRWWNPAVENQATDRAYRIGQHRNVLVHKFVCRGTIEEKIDALISEKTALSE